jgi:ribosomal-protein-serine acetyltransferase
LGRPPFGRADQFLSNYIQREASNIPTLTSILIDDDLLLRSYKPEDAPELFRCVNESRAHLRPFLNWVDATTKTEHSLQFIQSAIAQQAAGEAMALGIFLQRERQLIGGIGMHHWNHDLKRAQVGYWIAKEYEGKGLMYRSAIRFMDFLFRKVGLNKVEMRIVSYNTRSLALAASLGTMTEGRIRQSLKVAGKLEDVIVAGILRNEWEALHAGHK